MPIFRGDFYKGDDITLKGQFESDGVAQTPDAGSAKISVYKKGEANPIIDNDDAGISTTVIYYKMTNLGIGEYVAYLTATFNTGQDKRTGEINFVVKDKGGIW